PEKPIPTILGYGRGLQGGPPIVRSVNTLEHEAVGLRRPEAAPEPADPRPANRHAGMSVQADAVSFVLVGPHVRRRPAEDRALGKINLDVGRTDNYHSLVIGVPKD